MISNRLLLQVFIAFTVIIFVASTNKTSEKTDHQSKEDQGKKHQDAHHKKAQQEHHQKGTHGRIHEKEMNNGNKQTKEHGGKKTEAGLEPDLEEFDPNQFDPNISHYIHRNYSESDFDKVIYADGDNVTVVERQKDYPDYEEDPEVKELMKKYNETYRGPKIINYFNRTVKKVVKKTPEELEFLQKRNQIVPDLIKEPALHVLQVAFNDVVVNFGNEIHAAYTVKAPTLVSWPVEKDAEYCLIMTDPDTALHTRIQRREWQHWVVGNIPGKNIIKGELLTEYVRPMPEYDRGFHRFIFYVYKQPAKQIIYHEIKLSSIPVDSLRKDFSTQKFAEKYNFSRPVAINFFIADWNKTVHDDNLDIF